MKPADDFFKKRGRAFEEAFFQERDQHLLEALRRRFTADEARKVLEAATGVKDHIVIHEIAELDAPQFLAVLGIFPLVEVAWCDGHVSDKERQAMLDAAADMGISDDSTAHQLLKRWLESRPGSHAFTLWTDYVHAICATLKDETVEKLKQGVMGRSRKIAEATGGILGLGSKISPAEQQCLDELSKAFKPHKASE